LAVVSATSGSPFRFLRLQWNVCHPILNRFTRQTLPTIKRECFFTDILCRSEASRNLPLKAFFFRWVVSPTPNPKAGGPPLVGSPRLLSRYFRSYSPYLEAVFSKRNLKTRHNLVARIGAKRVACRILVVKRPLGRPRCRWVDNIKMNRMWWYRLDLFGSG
jgi:hypothetical protein